MVFYPYSFQAAFDPNQGTTAPRDSVGQVFAVGDRTFAQPLPTVDLNGLPVTLTVGEFGYLPDFMVEDHTAVIWKSGEYVFQFATTIPVKGDEGDVGKSAYQSAVEQGFEGTEAEWLESLKGANILPTDEAIAASLTTPDSVANAALDQLVSDKLGTPGTLANAALDETVGAAFDTPGTVINAAALQMSDVVARGVVQDVQPAIHKVAASVTYGKTSGGHNYEFVRVHGGAAPGVVGKAYAYDYENAGTTGENFRPSPRETLDSFYRRTGAGIVLNGSGFDTSGGTVDRIHGAQIKDGVIYRDFFPVGSASGMDAIGFRADGTAKIYSVRWGDSAASMLADGVVNSFSFGAALIVNGVKETLAGTSTGARQVLGTAANGDVLALTVNGSASSGVTIPELATLAQSLGFANAVNLDGGGSAQSVANGGILHPSADTAPRPVADAVLIHATVTGFEGTSWHRMDPLQNGFLPHAVPPEFKVRDGKLQCRGAVNHPTATTATTAYTFPWWARPSTYKRLPATTTAAAVQYYDVDPAGPLILSATATYAGQRYLDIIDVTV